MEVDTLKFIPDIVLTTSRLDIEVLSKAPLNIKDDSKMEKEKIIFIFKMFVNIQIEIKQEIQYAQTSGMSQGLLQLM